MMIPTKTCVACVTLQALRVATLAPYGNVGVFARRQLLAWPQRDVHVAALRPRRDSRGYGTYQSPRLRPGALLSELGRLSARPRSHGRTDVAALRRGDAYDRRRRTARDADAFLRAYEWRQLAARLVARADTPHGRFRTIAHNTISPYGIGDFYHDPVLLARRSSLRARRRTRGDHPALWPGTWATSFPTCADRNGPNMRRVERGLREHWSKPRRLGHRRNARRGCRARPASSAVELARRGLSRRCTAIRSTPFSRERSTPASFRSPPTQQSFSGKPLSSASSEIRHARRDDRGQRVRLPRRG